MGRGGNSNGHLEEGPTTSKSEEMDMQPELADLRCVSHFSEYCRSTSMHGLRYVGDDQRPLAERLLWLLLFGISLAICSNLIRSVWLKWQRTPVIVTFAETSTPVWEVPFPAVTVCSQTKARREVFNYSHAYHQQDNLTAEERKKFEDLSLVCDEGAETMEEPGGNFTDQKTIEFLRDVAPTVDETIYFYAWRNHYIYEPAQAFRPKMTEEGLCFVFNMLDDEDVYSEEVVDVMKSSDGDGGLPRRPAEWNAEDGYKDGAGLQAYPLRSLGPGHASGLHLALGVLTKNIDYICKGPVQGFKILLHNPAEVPQVSMQYLRVPLQQEVMVAVHPHMLTTSDGLRSYSPDRRQCYFPRERHLRYFRTYTQRNCELECLTNYTLRRCSCVFHHMPRTEGTPLCGIGSAGCLTRANEEMVERKVMKDLQTGDDDDADFTGDCDCLPSCSDLRFDAEISQADFDLDAYYKAQKINMSEIVGYRMSSLFVYFKDNQFIPSRRSELYGVTDFIANCGGLLGLFMGFSVLSLVEIVYFFSIRIGFTQLQKRTTQRDTLKTM